MTADTSAERRVTQAQMDRLVDWSMRKPVIALMGEFSSGKSTLMNLLLGKNVLPTQVTATRMPPVWLTYGIGKPYRMDHDGTKHRVNLSKTDSIPIKRTSYIRLFVEADILKHCDLIDTPGISDPNIKTDYWIRTIRYANAVMWCTHAGQAWRESERGSWESLPMRLRETSILLVTRKDKITSERDLKKIDRRLERETEGLFNARMFVSLTNAIRAREKGDAAAWDKAGAGEFSDMLEQIVEGVYMQRSFLLARYVVGDGTAETRQAYEIESGSLLGFVEGGASASEEAESETAPVVSATPLNWNNYLDAADDDPAVEAEEADAMEDGAPEEADTADEDEIAEPMTFKAPRQDLDLASYRLGGHQAAEAAAAPEEEEAATPEEPAAVPEVMEAPIEAASVKEIQEAEEPAFRAPRQNVDLASYRLRDPSGPREAAEEEAATEAATEAADRVADAAAAPEGAEAVAGTGDAEDKPSEPPNQNAEPGGYRLKDPSASGSQEERRRVSMSEYRLKDPSVRDLVERVAELGRRAQG